MRPGDGAHARPARPPALGAQRGAWAAYQRWFEDERVNFMREPEAASFEDVFRAASLKRQPATKLWADAYLAAFAKTAGLRVVTFDQGFPRLAGREIEVLRVRLTM
jgi:uncharacterized protein